MKSKEALMTLAELNYYENVEDTGRKLGDEYKEEFETILKDLKDLEIFKEHFVIDVNKKVWLRVETSPKDVGYIEIRVPNLKEMLENGK